MGTMTRSLLVLKTLPSFAPLNCGPASRNAVSSPVLMVAGGRSNSQVDRILRFRCPTPGIPIRKRPTVQRDTVARSAIAASGPADAAASSVTGSGKRKIVT
ncbi:hypothetical protein B296_00023234 [Ensete ventricosum]|uniref:Uncharacterized protein n=1 Tax=Ensete ventricosum TaxID=4639 RepID=A0A426ZDG8_ENSVE|nr:hypothetical protein B296_00023234 [Ensete ventricosum]